MQSFIGVLTSPLLRRAGDNLDPQVKDPLVSLCRVHEVTSGPCEPLRYEALPDLECECPAVQ